MNKAIKPRKCFGVGPGDQPFSASSCTLQARPMIFNTLPENANDIRAICARFPEGIRVEYKGTFDQNVRGNLPKVLSSFANSLGGVLVVGVETENGVPREPIQGFATPQEELPLTVENICLTNINPPIMPRVRVIPSDVAGRSFVFIEVEESWEAPHAIENSKKVYVRTGSAANPYDLADVDLVIELVRRRAEPEAKRQRLVSVARTRASNVVSEQTTHVEIRVSPSYPRRVLCTRGDCWDFIANSRYRGAHYFPFRSVRRVEDGVASFNSGDQEYGQVSIDGVAFIRRVMQLNRGEAEDQPPVPVLRLAELFLPTLRLLHCAEAFYRHVGYRGDLTLDVTANNIRLHRVVFLRMVRGVNDPEDFQCFENVVSAREIIGSEQLTANLGEVVLSLMGQLCWSFWQGVEPFPAATLDEYLAQILREMGFR